MWNREDGAQFSFDGRDARWTPGNVTEDFTLCRYTVKSLFTSTTIKMDCQNLDTNRKATVSLSATGDIGTNNRTLTITGDQTLSGAYDNALPYARDTSSASPPEPTARPAFDPCTLLKPADLARTADYLKHANEKWRSVSEPKSGPFFGSCSYNSPDSQRLDLLVSVEVGYRAKPFDREGCQRIDITNQSWLCPIGVNSYKQVRVQLDDGTELDVRVGRLPGEDTDWIDDPTAAEALMKIILARI
ncbi:hypothetical protein [Streptomyces sp. NPDC055287]